MGQVVAVPDSIWSCTAAKSGSWRLNFTKVEEGWEEIGVDLSKFIQLWRLVASPFWVVLSF